MVIGSARWVAALSWCACTATAPPADPSAHPADGALDPLEHAAPPRACNGHPALCERRFDEVVLAATHNAMSNADEGWQVPNQTHGILRQLDDGVRGLLLDTHAFEGGTYLCHGFCELGKRPLVEALADIRAWLQAHPNEVLVLVFEDGITVDETAAAFDASGLLPLLYAHPDGEAWPTLGALGARVG